MILAVCLLQIQAPQLATIMHVCMCRTAAVWENRGTYMNWMSWFNHISHNTEYCKQLTKLNLKDFHQVSFWILSLDQV